jgi:PAS domain S-box-containing protein
VTDEYISGSLPVSPLCTVFHLLDELEDGIVIIDHEGRVRWLNRAMKNYFGISNEAAAGMAVEDFIRTFIIPVSDNPERITAAIIDSRAQRPENIEIHAAPAGRDGFWLEFASHKVEFESRMICRLDVYRRITRWKKTELSLRESEERFRMLFDKANDAVLVFVLTPDHRPDRFIEVNEVACRRLGYTREELIRLPPIALVPPGMMDEIRALMHRLVATGHILYETEHVTHEGRRVPVEINSHLFTMHGRPTVLSISRDISERKKIEEVRKQAFEQIESNIEQFAILGDHIRNPLSVIVGLAAFDETASSEKILHQAEIINGIVHQLDQGWIESENVRAFLRRHYS